MLQAIKNELRILVRHLLCRQGIHNYTFDGFASVSAVKLRCEHCPAEKSRPV